MEAAKLRFGLHRSCDPREMRHRPAAARQHHRRRYLANLVVCYWPSHCRPKRRARPEGRQFNGPHFFLNELYVGHDFHDARALLLGWREQIPGLRAGRWSPKKGINRGRLSAIPRDLAWACQERLAGTQNCVGPTPPDPSDRLLVCPTASCSRISLIRYATDTASFGRGPLRGELA